MSKVRIVTDSTADLPGEIVEKYGITVIPLKVHFGNTIFFDGINLDSKEFYNKLETSSELPTTSHPSPVEFVQYYEPFVEESDSIISIHISSKMSDTIQSAYLAKQTLNYRDIEIFDSRTVSAALGLMVIAAAKAAQNGKTKDEIIELLNNLAGSWNFFFTVDTLDYLKKGGRISLTQAFMGKLFKIKPLCTITDGFIYPSEKIKGKEKAINRMSQLMEENFKNEEVYAFYAQGKETESMQLLSTSIGEKLNIKESFENQLGPVVGTHVGPNVVGVAICSSRGII